MMKHFLILPIFSFLVFACSKKGNGNNNGGINHPPQATISAELVSVNPYTFQFMVTATTGS